MKRITKIGWMAGLIAAWGLSTAITMAQEPAQSPAAAEEAPAAQPAPRRGARGGQGQAQGQARAGQRPAREAKWVMDPIEGKNLYYKTFKSEAAGQDVSYLIYIPEEYETSADKRYPVMYWLHGIGGSQTGVPRLVDRYNDAMLAGKAPAMLAVFVNGMIDSFFCDSADGKTPVESMIIKDLIPQIDSTYRTIATREGRMIEGFSMGGFGAGHLGFKYPELFGSVSIIDGALLDVATVKTRHAELFQRIFGGSEETFTAAMPQTLIKENADAIRGKTVIRQAVGALGAPNEELHQELIELNIPSDYDAIEGVGHSHPGIYEGLGDKNWEYYTKAFAAVEAPKAEPVVAP